MQICIYCLERKPESAFNREHVINEAFGRFEGNLVLDCVCCECNQYFGDGIDRKLARDSIEGYARFWSGQKPASDFKSEGRRSTTRVELPDNSTLGKWGFNIPNEDGPMPKIRLFPQIGFRQPPGPITWYRIEDLPDKKDLDLGFELGKPCEVFFREMSLEDGQKLLEAKGYQPTELRNIESPPKDRVRAETIGTIDRAHERAISKIAFNYFAAVVGPIVRTPAFDGIRNFVRHDIGEFPLHIRHNPWVFVAPGNKPARDHYLCVETMPDGQIVAQVSLFLYVRYMARLLSVPLMIGHMTVSSCHFFDIDSKVAVRLPHPLPPGQPGEMLRPVGD